MRAISLGMFCCAIAATVSLPAWAQTRHSNAPRVLEPEGKNAVGHILLDLEDRTRGEPATEDPADHRKLSVNIWYPAIDGAAGAMAPYVPRAEAFRPVWGDDVDFINSVETQWIENAEPGKGGPFPLFVFSHGWGSRSASYGTFLAGLASFGYVVAGIDHPYMGKVALADGTVTEPNDRQFASQAEADAFYAQDVVFVIDSVVGLGGDDVAGMLTRVIDPERIAAGGHSSGFPAAGAAAVADTRIKALISFDSGVPAIVRDKGLDVPVLLFRGEKQSYTDLFFRGPDVHPKGTIYDVDFFRVHRADFYDLVIPGTTHTSIYDHYLYAATDAEREASETVHHLMVRFSNEFLGKALSGRESPSLEGEGNPEGVTLRVIKALKK